jgi:outer membrane immunogenic protein
MRFPLWRLLPLLVTALSAAPLLAEPFAGPHVEAIIGWNHDARNAWLGGKRGDGLLYGGAAGYDLRFGRVVAGIAGEISGDTGKSCETVNYAPFGDFPGVAGRACSRDGRSLFGGARLGYVVGGRALLYAVGGYANIRQSGTFDGTVGAAPLHGRDHLDMSGYRVGGGIDYALAPHAFVKVEYRYTRVDDHASLRRSQIVTGVGYRF